MRPLLACCFFAWSIPLLFPHSVGAAEPAVRAELVAGVNAVIPGQPFEAGLLLTMQPEWYVYWQNPGIAGLPPAVDWELPPGWTVSAFRWPLPHRKELGGLLSYVYPNQVLLPFTITPPAGLSPGTTVILKGNAHWLACKEICVPEDQSVSLSLPVAAANQPANVDAFAKFAAREPAPLPPGLMVEQQASTEAVVLTVKNAPLAWTTLDFYPLPDPAAPLPAATVERTDGGWRLTQPLVGEEPQRAPMRGLLVATTADGPRAFQLPRGEGVMGEGPQIPAAPEALTSEGTEPATAPAAGSAHFALQLLLAFLGGLLLNVMPCVLPVLSIKILHFTQQAGENRGKIFRLGLMFTAGIFAWFMGLGLVSAAIRASGNDVFWGTMFQQPGFALGLAVAVFLFSLSLLGVFEMVLPGGLTTRLSALGGEGDAGAFGNGFFATVMGSACTAPMLGPAIGWAFTQSPGTILIIFAAIAFGMSSPYLLLTANPAWMKFLPRPGAWMETFKQLMGFLLMPVVIWLVWVLGQQKGPAAMSWTLTALLGLGFLAWTVGRLQMTRGRAGVRRFWLAVACLVAVGSVWAGWGGIQRATLPGGSAADAALPALTAADWQTAVPWIPYSPAILQAALATEHPVFLDITADWCLSCKWNEQTVLATAPVRQAMQAAGVLPIKADWTNQDPGIGRLIQGYGRAGVPVYVFYAADRREPAVVLPEFLTAGIVLDIFE